MITRLFICFAVGVICAYSQPLDVNEHLVQPLNPPKDLSPHQSTQLPIDSNPLGNQLREVAKTQAELKAALESGLAENHPRVKSLRAKLAVLQSHIVVPAKPATPEPTEIGELRREMEALKKDSKQDQELLLKEMADMKATIQQLRDELAKLNNK